MYGSLTLAEGGGVDFPSNDTSGWRSCATAGELRNGPTLESIVLRLATIGSVVSTTSR